ncbi:DUF4303 domain-containing protein [Pseudomonas putida]|uniref:DUF4303 domain-containing protein n=1 Tax=Pseudomonas putida (strain W619) TaxID=390235 RepID=B1J8V6_PSEPW|nr:DUF4303 domain-containing protein [Pseudomonas putida]QQE86505.1 DUF4303 domain-containing protein [Pseudomonas putida]
MNWTEFEGKITPLVKQALDALQRTHSDERFYAFSLYTDSSAMTIAVAGSSLEALDLKVQKEDEEDREDSVSYFKWATSEWVYEGWRRDLFKNACKELREDSERTDISTFREGLYSAMARVLSSLRETGFFQSFLATEPILFVSVTDDNAAEELEDRTACRLNSLDVYEEFSSRYEA